MGTQGQPQQVVDLVTQLQSEITAVSQLFFGTIGELQRDGPPSSIKGEELIAPSTSTYNPKERAHGFAAELMQACKNIQTIAQRIPSNRGTEAEQIARIRELQARNQQLQVQLSEVKVVADIKQQQAQDLYGILAEHELKQRESGAAEV